MRCITGHFFFACNSKKTNPKKNVDGKIIENENVIFSNLKEIFKNFVSLDYDENANRFSISSTRNAYIIQLPIPLGNVIGMRKNDIQFNIWIFGSKKYFTILFIFLIDVLTGSENVKQSVACMLILLILVLHKYHIVCNSQY